MGAHEAGDAGTLGRLVEQLGARARKAWAGGVAGAGLAIGGVSVAGFWSDGQVDTEKVAAAAGTVVSGFVAGFLAVFFTPNANAPQTGAESVEDDTSAGYPDALKSEPEDALG